jgi:carbonic anhydrase/acetyltransferase-like protein (isoleucine patch superfamily)
MLIEHRGKRPHIHDSAYIAPTATICGDVTIAENCHVLFGAVIVAEGGSINIGAHCIIMENAVIRATRRHPTCIGDHVLVGPRAYLTGCRVEENVFLATGAIIFNGAKIGTRSEVRINGVVHLKSVLLPDATVPIGWVAVGDPAEVLPPNEHDKIWAIQDGLNFPKEVFGLERAATGETIMPEVARRYTRALSAHREDKVLDEQD